MRPRSALYVTLVLLLAALGLAHARAKSPVPAAALLSSVSNVGGHSRAYQWLDIALEATAHDADRHGARPTILSRTLAIAMTAMFDAWAAYDAKAVGSRLGGALRRPPSERTLANKNIAVSYAAYQALRGVYPEDTAYLDSEMKKLGYDPRDDKDDRSTPAGIGNTAAHALLAYRRDDGSNALGNEAGGSGAPYADYTGYKPVNTADAITDPNRWQPIAFDDGKGGKVTPGFLTPQWFKVKPFALESSDQFRPPPPPQIGSDKLLAEAKENMDVNEHLDCTRKAVVEYMRDGPKSTGQSGHWLKFAQMVSERDHDDLDTDVKLFFAVSNAAMDAFIAAWDSKRAYDSSRPWTLVHHYFRGKPIRGWGGPGKGIVTMNGEDWRPFSPPTFVTPPFPGYVSGHSCVSAASAEILRLFTGSDHFGQIEKRRCGAITEPSPGDEVTITLDTFTETANLAGISRVYGGYHTQSDNVQGLALGRAVAGFAWPKIKGYIDGTASN